MRNTRLPRTLLVTATALALLAGCRTGNQTVATPAQQPAATTTTTAQTVDPECAGQPPAVTSYAPAATPPDPTKFVNPGRLTVGVSADTLQMGARNPSKGQIEGFDIDILREVAKDLFGDPTKLVFKVIRYDQRIPMLESEQVDIVAHTMTINCARWKKIAFSSEYYSAGQKVLVAKNSAAQGIGDLGGQKVCAVEGSTNLDNLKPYKDVIAVAVGDITDCLVKFQQAEVAAITGDDTVLAGFAEQDPYALVVGSKFTQEPYGLGINAGRVDLVRFVNHTLERIRTGTWATLYGRWLATPLHAPGAVMPQPVYGR